MNPGQWYTFPPEEQPAALTPLGRQQQHLGDSILAAM